MLLKTERSFQKIFIIRNFQKAFLFDTFIAMSYDNRKGYLIL